MIESTLDEALDVARARKGNVQLRHQDGLRIVAHRGFQAPFLDYFACVNDEASACGRAMHRHERILIRDILSDPIGATPAGGVLVEAGVRAVQSTPIVGAAGGVIGMISTHYEFPLHDGGVEFDMLDRIAERAALFLEGDAVPR
jgi:GAF domain-containing protein